MNELQAAIGLVGLKNLEDTIQSRKSRFYEYMQILNECPKIVIPEIKEDWRYNYAYFPIFLVEGIKIREKVFGELKKNHINSRKYWFPLINKHPYYSNGLDDTKVSQDLSESVLALPMGNDTDRKTINLITEIIKRTVDE